VIVDAWKIWIQGSLVFIWEQKLKSTKKAITDWVQIKSTQEKKEIQKLTTRLEEVRGRLKESISPSPLIEDQHLFQKHQQVLKVEEANWRLNSRSLWLKQGDKNTKFFRRQAKATVWRNKISDIQGDDNILISGQDQIRQAAKKHFEISI
jgi:hypothetical protein